ncbi:MAG: adenylyltransferase/cytidyltransferase family protein [Alphaproteobacteria bacterium]|nr:adenylyltransferase/cytidyltransferase family protein [Alphaproteobacteria bacterium]
METRKVLTDGVFDLLHANHIALLEKARGLGDWLVVGVVSDRNAREYKRQPIIPQNERIRCIEALSCVDEVFLLDAPIVPETMRALVRDYEISIVVHAGTATPEFYAPAEETGIMHHLDYRPGVSSSEIIRRIIEMQQEGNFE